MQEIEKQPYYQNAFQINVQLGLSQLNELYIILHLKFSLRNKNKHKKKMAITFPTIWRK